MKNILLMTLLFLVLSGNTGFTQDNIYGDYLIGSLDKKVSLDLEGAQLVDVLKMLSRQIGLNFISTEAVAGRLLTLYMEEVPLKEAMDAIFKANNLAYDYYADSNIFVVKEMGKPALELVTKVYYLKHTRVASSKVEQQVTDMLEDDDDEGEEDDNSSDTEEEVGVKSAVESVLTEFGEVTEDPITNSLIVVDVPVQFSLIDEVIKKLDIPPLKVMIEVEMLDVNKGRLDQIGVNFANGAYASLTPGSRLTRWPWDNRFFSESSGGAEPGLTTLDLSGFTTVIQLLSQDQETKFLARPKILTLDKETATVNLTLNEVVGLTTTSDENGNISQEIERDDTGTKLEVTPQVNPDTNEITLVVDVSNKESTPSNISVSGMTAGFVQNIEERATRNIVRLKDGETLFIGGLMKKEEKEIITKIPFFGDLPLIGRLFRYKDRPLTDNAERELLVFLTPHILKEGESLIEKVHVLSREQQNFSKENSIKVALDRYNR